MESHWSRGLAALAVVLATTSAAVLACSDDPTGPAAITYVARLSGAQEVPAIVGGASGTATFTLNGKSLSYQVLVTGLSGNAAASHIHLGAAGVNGNILVPFNAAAVQNGEVASGIIDLTLPVSNGQTSISGDELERLLNQGMLYTNVHTAAHPAGEIRGQIVKATSGGSTGGGSGGGSGGGNGGAGGGGGIY